MVDQANMFGASGRTDSEATLADLEVDYTPTGLAVQIVDQVMRRLPPASSRRPLRVRLRVRLEAGECKGCGGEAVAPEVIAQHEGGCPYPGHDVLDDGGGRCVACGQILPPCPTCGPRHGRAERLAVDWVIVGGESGPGARPCNVSWIRHVVRHNDRWRLIELGAAFMEDQ
jgi:hypothetical protein